MMLLSWRCMLVFLQLFEDLTWYVYVKSVCIVIPFQANSAVEVAVPIHGELVIFLDALCQGFCLPDVGVLHQSCPPQE